MKNENEKHSLLFLNPSIFCIFMGHFRCHCWDQSGSGGNWNGTAVAVDAGEQGGGHSCRASGAMMGEWGERRKNSPPLFSGIRIGCGGCRHDGPGCRGGG
jgi:hypothetical protein